MGEHMHGRIDAPDRALGWLGSVPNGLWLRQNHTPKRLNFRLLVENRRYPPAGSSGDTILNSPLFPCKIGEILLLFWLLGFRSIAVGVAISAACIQIALAATMCCARP
jgi:hypothetical protein